MQNVINGAYKGRSAGWNKGNFGDLCVEKCKNKELGGRLGFFREYLAAVGGRKGTIIKNSFLADFDQVFANPRLRRFFSSEAPKKKSKNFLKGYILIHF